MDFHIAAPGGAAPGAPATLAARGADPAIDIPANPAHFFRRVQNAPLQPVAGALLPVPQLLSMSFVEAILGPAISLEGNPAETARAFLLRSILPTKFEAALTQLEAEPAGIGLNPTAIYESVEHAASEVLAAIRRVAARPGALHPAYVLNVADSYDLEPVAPGAPAAFLALTQAPTAVTFGQLTGPREFLFHYGFMAYLCYGRSLSNFRDVAGAPSRRFFPAIQPMAVLAGCAATAPAGTPVSSPSLLAWLSLTEPDADVSFFASNGGAIDARDQNARDRHNLRYGTADQKESLVSRLILSEPLKSRHPTLTAVIGPGASAGAATSALIRLHRQVTSSAVATITSLPAAASLEAALVPSAHALTAAGAVTTTLADRVERLVEALSGAPSASLVGGAPSVYAKDLANQLGLPVWNATEAALIAEMAMPVPRLVVLMELMTQSSILGVRQLALSKVQYPEQKRLLHLSPTLVKVMDLLTDDQSDRRRHRAVADALVVDPITRVPVTNEEITFHLTFPIDISKKILRGAFDEIDWIEILRLVLQVRNPNQEVAPYSNGLFDPMVPPLLIPLLERISALLGLPSVNYPGSMPAPAARPANFATLSTIVTSIAAEYGNVHGVPTPFTSDNHVKLVAFKDACFAEATSTLHRFYGLRNPSGPRPVSLLEPVASAAMAQLSTLQQAMVAQAQSARNQPMLYSMLSQLAAHGGSLEALVDSRARSRPASRASEREAKPSSSRDKKPATGARSRSSSPSRRDDVPMGSRYSEVVRQAVDGSGFWYVSPDGKKASPVFNYEALEKLAGKSRNELDFPVILSNASSAQARARLCGHVGEPGHEHALSSAHIAPTADFVEKAYQLFREPAIARDIVGSDKPVAAGRSRSRSRERSSASGRRDESGRRSSRDGKSGDRNSRSPSRDRSRSRERSSSGLGAKSEVGRSPGPERAPGREARQRREGSTSRSASRSRGADRAAARSSSVLSAGVAFAKKAGAMVVNMAGSLRPIVRLDVPPVGLVVRTFLLVIATLPNGPMQVLVPQLDDALLADEFAEAGPRKAAVAAAQQLLLQLPVRLSRDSLVLPCFESVPAAGDTAAAVDRIVVLPYHGSALPGFEGDGGSWLHWTTISAVSSLAFVLVAHAVNRVQTYRPTTSRSVLDQLMAASTRFRSGARELRLAASTHDTPPSTAAGRTFADAHRTSLAADLLLRRMLLAVPDDDPLADQLHAYADRISPCDLNEIPVAFKQTGALPDFSSAHLFMQPFSTRVQPPVTCPLPPVPPQPLPPPNFRPTGLRDLLLSDGRHRLTRFYADMYDWLLLVDELSPLLLRNRTAFRADLCTIAAGDVDVTAALVTRIGGDPRDPTHSSYVKQAAIAILNGSELRTAAPLRSMSIDVWRHWDVEYHGNPSDEEILDQILAKRPEPLALGQSDMVPEARGIVWDLRVAPPVPLKYDAPIKTHLNLSFIRSIKRRFPSYPDQEIFDHLLFGVRFKTPQVHQMLLQPHLSSLPLGFAKVHKELLRLVDKDFFACFENPPFCPWQTLAMGVAFRKLEPDRPRRTTDGGSPRRGKRPSSQFAHDGERYRATGSRDWLVDSDGTRVVPLNVATRWPAEDVERGTLDIFFKGWKERLNLKGRPGSPPPFHPLLQHATGKPRDPPPTRSPSPSSTRPRRTTSKRALVLFSGPLCDLSLSTHLRSLGWIVDDVDIVLGKAEHDVTIRQVAARILDQIRDGLYDFVWLAPPCKPFSVAADDRPQLFSRREPYGITPFRPEWAAYVVKAATITRFVAKVIRACDRAGVLWAAENPCRRDLKGVLGHWKEFEDYATIWHALDADPELDGIFFESATFPYCALGAPYQKATTLRSNCLALVRAFLNLVCTHVVHAERLRGSDRTAAAASYPPEMIVRAGDAIDLAVSASSEPSAVEVAPSSEPGQSSTGQLTYSSVPSPPALRVGQVVDVDITRGGPTPHFANPFKMGPRGTDRSLRELAVSTYQGWLAARVVRAADWPTALPVSRRLMDLRGDDVEAHLNALFEKHGKACRYHFVCGARCTGKTCHGSHLTSLAAQVLDGAGDPPFPKEVKPTVPEAMMDLAILMHLSHLTGLPVYQLGTDVSDFFNQHRLHHSEQPKVGLVTLDPELLVRHVGVLRKQHPRLCNVAEGVLGYGLFPASEVCQRHAYLLTFIWLVRMLERSVATVAALCQRYPVLAKWQQRRKKDLEPPTDGGDRTAAIRMGQSCFWCMSMYSDDTHQKILSSELMLLGLRVWIEITTELRLTMAIVQKQMIGQCITNQGLRFHSGLGITYVPQDKLRRAFQGLRDAMAGRSTLREYHSLLGLLQSLLFVVGLRKSATFGLWTPFAVASFNPEELMLPTATILERLEFWERRLAECSGASFESGIDRDGGRDRPPLPPDARVVYIFRSDASKEGAAMPGLGGCLGARGWRYPDRSGLSEQELLLPIPVTEFAAFYGQVAAFGDSVPDEAIVLAEVDALATTDALTTESAGQPLMQFIYQELEKLPQFQRLRSRMVISHVFGDANVMADAFSRGELRTARALASQMCMAYELVGSPKALKALMRRLVLRARQPAADDFHAYADSYEHAATSAAPLTLRKISLPDGPCLPMESFIVNLVDWLLARIRHFYWPWDIGIAIELARVSQIGHSLLGRRSCLPMSIKSQRVANAYSIHRVDGICYRANPPRRLPHLLVDAHPSVVFVIKLAGYAYQRRFKGDGSYQHGPLALLMPRLAMTCRTGRAILSDVCPVARLAAPPRTTSFLLNPGTLAIPAPCNLLRYRILILRAPLAASRRYGSSSDIVVYRSLVNLDNQVCAADARRWRPLASSPLDRRVFELLELCVWSVLRRSAVVRLAFLSRLVAVSRECRVLATLPLRLHAADDARAERLFHKTASEVWADLAHRYASLRNSRRGQIDLGCTLHPPRLEDGRIDWSGWAWPTSVDFRAYQDSFEHSASRAPPQWFFGQLPHERFVAHIITWLIEQLRTDSPPSDVALAVALSRVSRQGRMYFGVRSNRGVSIRSDRVAAIAKRRLRDGDGYLANLPTLILPAFPHPTDVRPGDYLLGLPVQRLFRYLPPLDTSFGVVVVVRLAAFAYAHLDGYLYLMPLLAATNRAGRALLSDVFSSPAAAAASTGHNQLVVRGPVNSGPSNSPHTRGQILSSGRFSPHECVQLRLLDESTVDADTSRRLALLERGTSESKYRVLALVANHAKSRTQMILYSVLRGISLLGVSGREIASFFDRELAADSSCVEHLYYYSAEEMWWDWARSLIYEARRWHAMYGPTNCTRLPFRPGFPWGEYDYEPDEVDWDNWDWFPYDPPNFMHVEKRLMIFGEYYSAEQVWRFLAHALIKRARRAYAIGGTPSCARLAFCRGFRPWSEIDIEPLVVDWDEWEWFPVDTPDFIHLAQPVVPPNQRGAPVLASRSSSPLIQEVITRMPSPVFLATLTQPSSYLQGPDSPAPLSLAKPPQAFDVTPPRRDAFTPIVFAETRREASLPSSKRARPSPALVQPPGYDVLVAEPDLDVAVNATPTSATGLAARVASMLEADTSRLALRPSGFSLFSICERLYDPTDATAPRTSKGQQSAWKHWSEWCRMHNTDPWRLERHSTDVDHHREAVLQAGFLRFAHLRQSARPRNGRKAALPSSAVKTLTHIRKMHKDRDFPMSPSSLVQVEIRRLLSNYKSEHGCQDLIPKQKQPFTRDILLGTILGTPNGYKLGNYSMRWNSRRGRSIAALTRTLSNAGFRKAEISVEKHGNKCDADCLSRASLSWYLRSKLYTTESVPHELLRSPQPGDFAVLTPPPSKSDPYDMVWGNKPIWLPFLEDELAAFNSLAQIELNDGFVGPPHATALFTDDDGLAFSGPQLDRLLRAMMLRQYTEQVASNYSWHSARIFLATALLASNASRAQIQALCRWQTEESLNIYACLGASQYGQLVGNALATRIDAARATTLADAVPFIDQADLARAWAAAAPVTTQVDLDTAPAPDDDADDD